VLAAVRQVLKEAKRRRYIEFNPLDDADCFLRTETPNRSFLELVQIEALLDAARLLDEEQRRLEWRDVHAIRASSEPATALAGRYGVSDTLIRRIARGEIWTDGRRPDLARLQSWQRLCWAGRGSPSSASLTAPTSTWPPGPFGYRA